MTVLISKLRKCKFNIYLAGQDIKVCAKGGILRRQDKKVIS